MRVRARTIILGLVGLLVVLLLVAITAVGWQVVLGPRARAVTSRTFAPTDARIARGKYLVEGPLTCFHCHSEHDTASPEFPPVPGKKGAGWLMPIAELGKLYARNITPDPETGIGRWTDDEIARAIQEGISSDGHALFPVMPYMSYRQLDEEDLASVVVYLKTVPPVRNAIPARELIFPLSLLVKTMPQPLLTPVVSHAKATPAERGKYLVTVGSCSECHTPAEHGQPLPGLDFGGGGHFALPGSERQVIFSANITPDPSGIQHYDEALFMQTLRTGRLGGRVLNHIMPFENYGILTDDDLRDIFAFLKTLTPVKHRVSNTDPPTPCALCKQSHGLGSLNK